jgi:hypothetical protein
MIATTTSTSINVKARAVADRMLEAPDDVKDLPHMMSLLEGSCQAAHNFRW